MKNHGTETDLMGHLGLAGHFCLSTFSSALPIPWTWVSDLSSSRTPGGLGSPPVSNSIGLIWVSNEFPAQVEVPGFEPDLK